MILADDLGGEITPIDGLAIGCRSARVGSEVASYPDLACTSHNRISGVRAIDDPVLAAFLETADETLAEGSSLTTSCERLDVKSFDLRQGALRWSKSSRSGCNGEYEQQQPRLSDGSVMSASHGKRRSQSLASEFDVCTEGWDQNRAAILVVSRMVEVLQVRAQVDSAPDMRRVISLHQVFAPIL